MTIVGKKKDAKETKREEVRDIIRFDEDEMFTYCLIKGGEHLAQWVKIKKEAQGIRIVCKAKSEITFSQEN
jgi:hypothetical protein